MLRPTIALLSVLAGAGALLGGSAAAPAKHGPELWAGQWTTNTGGVAWRAFNEQDLRIAKTGADAKELFDKLPCKNGPRFYRGGYMAGGDRGKIMGCGTPTNMRGRWRSNVGGVNGSYVIHISSQNPLKFTGTFRQDDGVTGTYKGTWASHFDGDGCCTEDEQGEPTLPDALVPIESVSNGCGGGKASLQGSWRDTSVYLDTNDPFGKRYPVNFREACNLHDAGYSGAKVRDVLHGGKIVDFFEWTRERVDEKFLEDMQMLCRQKISALAPGALADCRGTGGKTSLGARTRYNLVRDVGDLFWIERPKLRGWWATQNVLDAPLWAVVQTLRSVKASWRGGTEQPDLRGEFKGTLITRDDDSIVKGFAKITQGGKTVQGQMTFTINPLNLNLFVRKGLGGSANMVRSRKGP